MAIVQISKIQIRAGLKSELPDSLAQGEFAFTTDTGEIFLGAPNFTQVQYRAIANESISPYRNIKVLTEFDVLYTITGDVYTQGPLLSIELPAANGLIFTYATGINTSITDYSITQSNNTILGVGTLWLCVGQSLVSGGMTIPNIVFTSGTDSSGNMTLSCNNTTTNILTLQLNSKNWSSVFNTNF